MNLEWWIIWENAQCVVRIVEGKQLTVISQFYLISISIIELDTIESHVVWVSPCRQQVELVDNCNRLLRKHNRGLDKVHQVGVVDRPM